MAREESEALSIVIVGAGIGGLSAAIGCALGGHKVKVLESAKELAEIGAGFQITPNASKIMLRWGLEDEMKKSWAEPISCTVHRYTGKVLAHEAQFAQNCRRKYSSPFVDMHRVDTQRMLYNKARDLGVEIQLNTRISSVRQCDEGSPEVVCKDGTVVAADLVIGADGLWSRCRESMLGKSDPPTPTGDLAYRIVLTLDQISDPELKKWVSDPTLHFWIGPYTHAVGYSVKSGTMYNLVLLCPDDLPAEVSKQSGSVDEMRKLFVGWDPILTRMLDCVATVEKWKLMYRTELESWTNAAKNFVLMGDSCHPMLPYLAAGANSAVEDGAVLGRALSYAKSKTQMSQAVALYERLRKTRGEGIVRETFAQRADFHMPDGPEQEARDKIFESQLGKDEAEVKFPSRWNCPVVQPWLYGYDAYAEVDTAIKQRPFI